MATTHNKRVSTWWTVEDQEPEDRRNPKVDVRELTEVYHAWRNTVLLNCTTDTDRQIEDGRIPQNYYSLIYGLSRADSRASYNRLSSVYNDFWNFFALCREHFDVACENLSEHSLSETERLTEYATEWVKADREGAREVLGYFRQAWGSKPSEVPYYYATRALGQLVEAAAKIEQMEPWQDAISGPPKPD